MNHQFLVDCEHSITLGEKTCQFLGLDWLLGKSSKSSGYQYRLQNNQLGLIIFFKMFHSMAETIGSHLKIDCSPWFLDCAEAHYPAIHLAVDVQGWQPEDDLSEKMLCRSTRVAQYNGMDKAEFNVSEVSCIYDRSQSFKFGSAGAVQMAIYNKTIQARTIDKFDYMEHKWLSNPAP